MTKNKRAKFFETKNICFALGLIVSIALVGLLLFTSLFQSIESKVFDYFFSLRQLEQNSMILESGVEFQTNLATKANPAITIVAIDDASLRDLGRYPFPRYIVRDFVNNISKNIMPQPRQVFLDIMFNEKDTARNDAVLVDSLKQNGNYFTEVFFNFSPLEDQDTTSDGTRMQDLTDERVLGLVKKGSIENIEGDLSKMPFFLGADAPMLPYISVAKSYGHGTFLEDTDKVYRRQPLIIRYYLREEIIKLDDLNAGYSVSDNRFETLGWRDRFNNFYPIQLPLTEQSLAELKSEMKDLAYLYRDSDIQSINAHQPVSSVFDTVDTGNEGKSLVVYKYKSYFIPSITLSMALDYFNKSFDDVEVKMGESITIKGVPSKNGSSLKIPIDSEGKMVVNYIGPPHSFDTISFSTLKNAQSNKYGNKILLVGSYVQGTDEKSTPVGLMNGVEMHANALNGILNEDFLYNSPQWIVVLLVFVMAILVCFYTSRLPTLIALPITVAVIFGGFALDNWYFQSSNSIFFFTPTAIAMLLSFILVITYRAMTEEKDKRKIRETFSKYVSPKYVDQLANDPPELGGVDKQLTVLFSDIRGFTTLSENMSPQELVNHLNAYLTSMTDLILEYDGTLDKYVGDEVMCFWGAPLPQSDHAELACKCALRQMAKLKELNDAWPPQKRINIGIGLNSGIMTVGNMGSPTRMNYTLMGDNVNLGARLEGTNKQYGTNIIVSEFTYGLVKDKFLFRELDNIRVKGKNKPVVIYELIDTLDGVSISPKGK